MEKEFLKKRFWRRANHYVASFVAILSSA